MRIKKKYILIIFLILLVTFLFQFIPLINCLGNKEINFVETINNRYELKYVENKEENIKKINQVGEQIALTQLKHSHNCTPYFAIPKFLVYDGNTYLSENNTYVYQFKYDVYGKNFFTDMGGWMAGDGLIQDGIFTTSIKYKNRYLEFKEVNDKLVVISYGKMYGI